LPKIGKHHYDAIEGLVLIRTQETQLVIARGYASQESYQRQGDRFVLQSIRQRGGARIDLHSDRSGRGINLQWQGTGPDAKAVREWADDGSFDTRLAWDADVR
ncbi:hypothetical protein AAZU54_27215, partial [Pseudomonas sp. Je.1.5.c]|uniref:hypothetical protein n=1 Tax=Pseudomonas sp. Je.1.5.c TaxID=3142839 RepID=UPI003DA91535